MDKEVNGEIYSGSAIKMGEAECVVKTTGMDTFFGRTAGLVSQTESSTHFQNVLKSIGWFCISFILIWVCTYAWHDQVFIICRSSPSL